MMNRFYTLVFLFILCLPACATEYNLATGRQESLMYGTDKEVKIGDAVARQVEAEYDIVTDIDINDRVRGLLDRLLPHVDRKDLVYVIRVIDADDVNAVSLPGGYIYVFKGLVDKVSSDDQLAGVIAHELGHITARHGIKRIQASYGYTALQALAIASQDMDAVQGVNAIATSLFFAYSQEDEFESDRLAVRYMKKAGYDPQAMIEVLGVLHAEQEKQGPRQFSYWRTHPHIPERKAVVNSEIQGRIGFQDYLNLTGNE